MYGTVMVGYLYMCMGLGIAAVTLSCACACVYSPLIHLVGPCALLTCAPRPTAVVAYNYFMSHVADTLLLLEEDPTIQPDQFQQKWACLPTLGTARVQLNLVPTTDQVEILLSANHVICLASGNQVSPHLILILHRPCLSLHMLFLPPRGNVSAVLTVHM